MSGDECVLCPEGTTTAEKGSTSVDECSLPCGLPHSSTAGDNAQALVPAMADMAAADLALTPPIGPYSQAVKDEKDAAALKKASEAQLVGLKGTLDWREKELDKAAAALAEAQAALQTALNVAQAGEAGAASTAIAAANSRIAAESSRQAGAQADVAAAAAQVSSAEQEIARLDSLIASLQSAQAAESAIYGSKYASREGAAETLAPLLAINTEEETKAHFEQAKNRCQPHLLCIQGACQGSASASHYPHPCHPWPACADKMPSGGYENNQLKPLTPAGRAVPDVAGALESYDAAAGYDADPAVGYNADRLERGSTGAAAFQHEFDQR